MDTTIGGILVIGVLLGAVVLMSRASILANTTVGTAVKQAADVAGERSRTDLNVVDFPTVGTKVDVNVKNTGNTSISDFPHMDYIVAYTQVAGGPSGSPVVERLTYITGSPPSGRWGNLGMTLDSFQPGVWDPGETALLSGGLTNTPLSGTTGTVWISSPNGVVAIGNFTVP